MALSSPAYQESAPASLVILRNMERSTYPQLSASAPQEDPYKEPVIPDESCFNQNPCCATWAENGGCQRDIVRMTLVCPASCQLCTPRAYKLQDDSSRERAVVNWEIAVD
ncbi:shTK domain protein [Ancylostoma duodenale]|uniref:ShTK domain protein n=1 Tax=Ancylostoma duodenale TaxID=51022 RepID=A0A0C2CKL2_9BILA|nr:shTK domain protein [Ancylostoma duodenale]